MTIVGMTRRFFFREDGAKLPEGENKERGRIPSRSGSFCQRRMNLVLPNADHWICVKFDWLPRGRAAHTQTDRVAVLHFRDEEGMT